MRNPLILRSCLAGLCSTLVAGSAAANTIVNAPPRGGLSRPGYLVPHVNPKLKALGVVGCFNGPLGIGAFIGANNGNVAQGLDSGVISGAGNDVCDIGSGIGTGVNNTISGPISLFGGAATASFIAAGAAGAITNQNSFIGAGTGNTVGGEDAAIGAGTGNTVGGEDAAVAAGVNNVASGNGAFIGAGGVSNSGAVNNTASGTDSFIGAGDGNRVGGLAAFIGSGQSNTVTQNGRGISAAAYSVIVGGLNNSILPRAPLGGEYAFLGGGLGNTLASYGGVIAGGASNYARGGYAAIPGGFSNIANGTSSFAAGNGSHALNDGTFVWSDDAAGATTLTSSAPNQFLARASGGVAFFSSPALSSGVLLGPGAGSWSSLSDRASKTAIVALDADAVLAKVATLPVSEWSYRTEDRSIRHVGPMAQDFYAAFGVGEDDRHITSIDEDGVALAAIKALAAKNEALEAQNASLEARLRRVESNVTDLLARLK